MAEGVLLEIEKESLINLWMEQGFLQLPSTGQFLEDVDNEYFLNLVSRSFLEDVTYLEDVIVTSKMHDLATLVAKPECILVNLDTRNVDERNRHASFYSKLE
ncbi:hypothetical protein Patl1_05331 [Pistacia atlantica]|uniref:Uncharacterized protein n=1 Tax=Pistacia atlantica TaxID=434234 RepID=A0ACC1BVJ0_9ROSI|nr:hypothetical protein Patl1_05331 [Pistacia atlantica]